MRKIKKSIFAVFTSLLLSFAFVFFVMQKVSIAKAATDDEGISHEQLLQYFSNTRSLNAENQDVSLLAYDSVEYVYTPNGTPVEVIRRFLDYSESEKDEINKSVEKEYPLVKRLGPPTTAYNCHSYAWYMNSTDNPFWMNDPTPYYNDGSYIESSSPGVGKIICYYDSNDVITHSGIITDKTISWSKQLSNFTVTSKWGGGGLYEHNATDCPYYSDDSTPIFSRVRYFIQNTIPHVHTYDEKCVSVDEKFHKSTCICGESRLSAHYVISSEVKGRRGNCADCGKLLDLGTGPYPSIITGMVLTPNGSYVTSNGILVLDEADVDLYFELASSLTNEIN